MPGFERCGKTSFAKRAKRFSCHWSLLPGLWKKCGMQLQIFHQSLLPTHHPQREGVSGWGAVYARLRCLFRRGHSPAGKRKKGGEPLSQRLDRQNEWYLFCIFFSTALKKWNFCSAKNCFRGVIGAGLRQVRRSLTSGKACEKTSAAYLGGGCTQNHLTLRHCLWFVLSCVPVLRTGMVQVHGEPWTPWQTARRPQNTKQGTILAPPALSLGVEGWGSRPREADEALGPEGTREDPLNHGSELSSAATIPQRHAGADITGTEYEPNLLPGNAAGSAT